MMSVAANELQSGATKTAASQWTASTEKTQNSGLGPVNTIRNRQLLEQRAIEIANRRVAQLLQRPEQLDRIGEHRHQIVRDKTAVDSRLKAVTDQHIDSFQTILQLLQTSDGLVRGMQKNMSHLLDKCRTAESAIGNWEAVKELNNQRSQLTNATAYIDNIFAALSTAKALEQELNNDEDCNLLSIHSRKADLEACRDELLYNVQGDVAQMRAVQTYFADIDRLGARLESRMWNVLSQMLSILQSKPRKVVSVFRIVEREEAMDKEMKKGTLKLDMSSRPRKYKTKALEVLRAAADQRFQALVVPTDCRTTIANLRCIIPDLTIIKESRPRFPPTYDMFSFYVNLYHTRTAKAVDDLASLPDLDTADIWLLLSYSMQYADEMRKKLDVDEAMLVPPMLQGKRDQLLDRYGSLIIIKMRSWCKNIIVTEWEEWFSGKREDPPDTNAEGHFVTQVPIILFQMIDQQVDVANQANSNDFKKMVVRSCSAMLSDFTDQFLTAVAKQGECLDRQEGHNECFLVYMMVIINNSLRCQAYCKQLAGRLANEGADGDTVMDDLDKSLHEFERLGALASAMLTKVVFGDIGTFFTPLFTRQWLTQSSEQSLGTIQATLLDYCAEFKERIDSECYEKLVSSIHVQFLSKYVQRLFDKGVKIKPETNQRIQEDMALALNLFEQLGAENAKEKQDTVLALGELCTVDDEMLALSYVDLKTRQPELALEHVFHILYYRDDMSRSQRQELMEQLRATPIKGENSRQYLPGFFDNIKVPDKGAW